MSDSATAELGLNTKRTAVRLTGLPLLALSFQTLGVSKYLFNEIMLLTRLIFRHYLL